MSRVCRIESEVLCCAACLPWLFQAWEEPSSMWLGSGTSSAILTSSICIQGIAPYRYAQAAALCTARLFCCSAARLLTQCPACPYSPTCAEVAGPSSPGLHQHSGGGQRFAWETMWPLLDHFRNPVGLYLVEKQERGSFSFHSSFLASLACAKHATIAHALSLVYFAFCWQHRSCG